MSACPSASFQPATRAGWQAKGGRDAGRSLPQDPNLGQLRNQARELQRAVRAGDAAGDGRLELARTLLGLGADPGLRDRHHG